MKNLKLRKSSHILILALLFVTITLSAQQMRRDSQNYPPHMEQNVKGHKGERGSKGPHIPDLTEEQKEQLKGFRVELQKEVLPLENRINEKEARLRTLTTSESYNASAVENLIEEIGEVKTELRKLKVGQIQKIKSLLTEEQLTAFNKQIANSPKKGPHKR